MKIPSIKNYLGLFSVPGDKSITHRAVMLSSVANGQSYIRRPLISEDCLSTIDCMKKLGAQITLKDDLIVVNGANKLTNNAQLYCGNSGTTMRLLMGLLSGKGIEATLTGDESLSVSPMERVAKPLRQMGANITTEHSCAPVNIYAAKLSGAEIQMQVASAQVKSAILLAGLSAEGETTVIEKVKSRDHTELMLKGMGADIKVNENAVTVKKSNLSPIDITVPSDISSAAYFLCMGALLGETTVKSVGINPTRAGLLKVFDMMGVNYVLENIVEEGGEPVADITVKKSHLKAINLDADIMPTLIDELPVIAVLCAYAEGTSIITGAEELKVKECDRILATAEMIQKAGGQITATDDGFIIQGKQTLKGDDINSYTDHRIAMAGAVLLAASENGGEIIGHTCVNISFPNFFEMFLGGLRA